MSRECGLAWDVVWSVEGMGRVSARIDRRVAARKRACLVPEHFCGDVALDLRGRRHRRLKPPCGGGGGGLW